MGSKMNELSAVPPFVREFFEEAQEIFDDDRTAFSEKLRLLFRSAKSTGFGSWLLKVLWPFVVDKRERFLDALCLSCQPDAFLIGFGIGAIFPAEQLPLPGFLKNLLLQYHALKASTPVGPIFSKEIPLSVFLVATPVFALNHLPALLPSWALPAVRPVSITVCGLQGNSSGIRLRRSLQWASNTLTLSEEKRAEVAREVTKAVHVPEHTVQSGLKQLPNLGRLFIVYRTLAQIEKLAFVKRQPAGVCVPMLAADFMPYRLKLAGIGAISFFFVA